MKTPGYDFEGCVRLLGAVIRQELRDARGDVYKMRRVADQLGMTLDELLGLWKGRRGD